MDMRPDPEVCRQMGAGSVIRVTNRDSQFTGVHPRSTTPLFVLLVGLESYSGMLGRGRELVHLVRSELLAVQQRVQPVRSQ